MDYTLLYSLENNIYDYFKNELCNVNDFNSETDLDLDLLQNNLFNVNQIVMIMNYFIEKNKKIYKDSYYEYTLYDKMDNIIKQNDCYQVKGEKIINFINLLNIYIQEKMNNNDFLIKYQNEIEFLFDTKALLHNKKKYILPNIIMNSWHTLYIIFLIKN